MKKLTIKLVQALLVSAGAVFLLLFLHACTVQPGNTNSNVTTQVTPSPSPAATIKSQITLPILDALLRDDTFVNELKSKLQLSDSQIQQLKQTANAELTRLRQENAEQL